MTKKLKILAWVRLVIVFFLHLKKLKKEHNNLYFILDIPPLSTMHNDKLDMDGWRTSPLLKIFCEVTQVMLNFH